MRKLSKVISILCTATLLASTVGVHAEEMKSSASSVSSTQEAVQINTDFAEDADEGGSKGGTESTEQACAAAGNTEEDSGAEESSAEDIPDTSGEQNPNPSSASSPEADMEEPEEEKTGNVIFSGTDALVLSAGESISLLNGVSAYFENEKKERESLAVFVKSVSGNTGEKGGKHAWLSDSVLYNLESGEMYTITYGVRGRDETAERTIEGKENAEEYNVVFSGIENTEIEAGKDFDLLRGVTAEYKDSDEESCPLSVLVSSVKGNEGELTDQATDTAYLNGNILVNPQEGEQYTVTYVPDPDEKGAYTDAKAERILTVCSSEETLMAECEGVVIELTAARGVFPDGCTLKAEKAKATSKEKNTIDSTIEENRKVDSITLYELTILDKDGNKIEPNGEVKVTFHDSMPEDGTVLSVLHFEENDAFKTESLSVTKEGKDVVIVTDSFSKFALVRTAAVTTYTITYTLNGGTADNPASYQDDTDTFTLNVPTKDGYTFTGWTGSNGTTPETMVTISKGTTGNLSYTANWTKTSYTLTYDLQGGRMEAGDVLPISYTIESRVEIPVPRRIGYIFLGWTGTDVEKETVDVVIPKGSTGDRSYTAHWSVSTYTLSFDANGGSGHTDSVTATYGKTVPAINNQMYRTGYSFDGYWLGAENEAVNLLPSNPSWYRGSGSGALTKLSDGTYQLTNPALGHDNSNAGECTARVNISNVISTGKQYTMIVTYKTSDNLHSVDFYCYTSDSRTYIYTKRFSKSSKWTTVYLSFDTTGNTSYGSWIVRVDNNGNTDGKTSTLWFKDVKLVEGVYGEEFYDADNNPLVTYNETFDTTVSARWKPHQYTIHFDANGGEGTMADENMTYDESAVLTSNSYTKLGNSFVGWSTDKNAVTAQYTDMETVKNMTTEDGEVITLYAVWNVLHTYTVIIPKKVQYTNMPIGPVDETVNYDIKVLGNFFGKVNVTSKVQNPETGGGKITAAVKSEQDGGFTFTAAENGRETSQEETLRLTGTASVGKYVSIVQYECEQVDSK